MGENNLAVISNRIWCSAPIKQANCSSHICDFKQIQWIYSFQSVTVRLIRCFIHVTSSCVKFQQNFYFSCGISLITWAFFFLRLCFLHLVSSSTVFSYLISISFFVGSTCLFLLSIIASCFSNSHHSNSSLFCLLCFLSLSCLPPSIP